ncbi:MAG: hypothetical protein RLZZ332_1272 [Actinomycetota bacterium]
MELSATLRTTAPVSTVLGYVRELDAYPQWMSLAHTATPELGSNPVAWSVELRARVGPFARSKRLRMVRTVMQVDAASPAANTPSPAHIVFERHELDGRSHAQWRLAVTVSPTSEGSELAMHLSYDGRFFVGVVESILRQHIDEGRQQLGALLGG